MFVRNLISSAALVALAAACSVQKPAVVTAPQGERPEVAGRAVERAQTQEERAATERRFRTAASAYTAPSAQVSTGVDQDTEPAVTAVNVGGTDYTATAFIKITEAQPGDLGPFRARIHTTSTTNLASFPTPTAVTHPASPLAGSYLHSADPYVAANNTSFGVAPGRTYLVGLAYNMSDQHGTHNNGGIVVWRSDSGGTSWPASTIVAETAQPRVYDKPHIAVSWNTQSYDNHGPTAGSVYVVWVDVNQNAQTSDNRILFSRSTDGGVSWTAPKTIATGFVHTPQVVVPSNTGRVFVLYSRYTSLNNRSNSIEMWRSLDEGNNFSQMATLTDARMFGPGQDGINGRDPVTNGYRAIGARTVFLARYNPWVGIQVVWHGEDPINTSTADIWYAFYNGTWSKTNITPQASGDQWNAAFDYDSSGNAMVTWLDRRNDPNNLLYQPYYKKINTAGTELQAPAALDGNTSDPSLYTRSRSVGEYADTWYFNYAGGSRWVSVWPRIFGVNHGDIYATPIVP